MAMDRVCEAGPPQTRICAGLIFVFNCAILTRKSSGIFIVKASFSTAGCAFQTEVFMAQAKKISSGI
jgi:hypothetical protein